MNTHLSLPYGKQHLSLELPKECLHAVIESQLASYSPGKSQEQIVEEALAQPHGTASLKELAFGCKKVVIITSDHILILSAIQPDTIARRFAEVIENKGEGHE